MWICECECETISAILLQFVISDSKAPIQTLYSVNGLHISATANYMFNHILSYMPYIAKFVILVFNKFPK